mgnify:CR=1 FL=1
MVNIARFEKKVQNILSRYFEGKKLNSKTKEVVNFYLINARTMTTEEFNNIIEVV